MTFIEWILPLAVLLVLSTFSGRILRKKYNITKKKGWIYEPVNPLQKRVEALLMVFYILLYTGLSAADYPYANYLIYGFFLLLFAFRVFIEWKYDRESKEFIISVNSLSWFILFITIVLPQLLEK